MSRTPDLATPLLARLRLRSLYDDPVAWAGVALPSLDLAPYQADALRELPRRGRVALRSMHGAGKSTLCAVCVLWFALTRDSAGVDWKVITTASAWRHLQVYLWPEIHKWATRIDWVALGRGPLSRGELLGLQLKLTHGAATAVASNVPERIEGAHAVELLYLLDEAKIIPAAAWDSIEGAFSNAGPDTGFRAYALATSTPGPPSGRFYDIHRRAPGLEDWHVRHVTLAETVAAGRVSQAWADQRRLQWGEKSSIYQNRVLGNFHADGDDACIPLAWVEAAIERWHDWDGTGRPDVPGGAWLGVDVGRGGDASVYGVRRGLVLAELTYDHLRDTMAVVGKVQATGLRPIIDANGIGAGVYDRLRELHVPALSYVGSRGTSERSADGLYGFVNTRSAAYWNVRHLLDPAYGPKLALPPDELMISDLTAPRWSITSGIPPRIAVERKEDVVKRLGRSPDRGDTVVMAMWADRHSSGDRDPMAGVPVGRMPTTRLSPLS